MGCAQRCLCQSGGSCDPESGRCVCPSGWTGSACELGERLIFMLNLLEYSAGLAVL